MKLLEEAKALKIKVAHLMKDETLAEKIAQAKASVIIEPAESVIVEIAQVVKPKDDKRVKEIQQKAEMLRRVLGDHDQKYLQHISMYRDFITDEYNKHKHLVDCYL